MKLFLVGHEYKYAVEQIMLALFPRERPEYAVYDPNVETDKYGVSLSESSSDDSSAFSATSRLTFGSVYAQAITVIRHGDDVSREFSCVKRSRLTDRFTTDRYLQRIIKKSFYKASMRFIDSPPVWGSLTGIRPARIAAAALSAGKSEKSAVKCLVDEYNVTPERAIVCVEAARSANCVAVSLEPIDIALYIGVPFCPSRCAYCSFVSNSVEKSFGLIDPFVQTLLREIDAVSKLIGALGLRVITVYFGGGTPTALPDESIEAIFQAIDSSIDMTGVREYTVEAGRPDTITARKLEMMRRFGVRRVCVNPQSMSDDVLNTIGRSHTSEDVLDALRLVRLSSLSLNMDIIAGLPGDALEGFQYTLDTVLDLNPENITVHTLALKKGSRIMLEDTATPSGADVSVMLEYASRRLRESGFRPYYLYRQKFTSGGFENTGWCLPGFEGLYNICMMEELCSVFALGGGAVTKLVSPGGRIERIFNAKYPREYILQSDKITDKIEKIMGFYR